MKEKQPKNQCDNQSFSIKHLFLMVLMMAGFATMTFAQEDTTITVWCWDPNFNIYAMEEAADIYKDLNPDVNVEIKRFPGMTFKLS